MPKGKVVWSFRTSALWELAERVIGGGTRDMLSDATVPLFMAH